MKEKSPSFQFYPKDLLSDGKAMAMPNECLGMYLKLLCHDWINDGLPEDDKTIMRLAGFELTGCNGKLRDANDYHTNLYRLTSCFIEHPKKKGFITNQRLLKERQRQEENRQKRVDAGKKGALAKWRQTDGNAIAKGMAKNGLSFSSSSSSSTSNKTKDIKHIVEKRILSDLKMRTGKKFKETETNLSLITARLSEGFVEQDFYQAHENQCREWLNDPDMSKYLRPETLYRKSKFDGYVNNLPVNGHKKTKAEKSFDRFVDIGNEFINDESIPDNPSGRLLK